MAKGESPAQLEMAVEIAKRLERLKQQLVSAGVSCRGLACWDTADVYQCHFKDSPREVDEAWKQAVDRVQRERQFVLQPVGAAALMCYPLMQNAERVVIAGVWVVQPMTERTAVQVQLSLGWLKSFLDEDAQQRGMVAAYLMEIHAHVLSQEGARSGAQEWVNRLAQLVRSQSADDGGCVLSFFEVDDEQPSWIVSSDTSWLEKGSSPRIDATNIALQTVLEMREISKPGMWSMPILERGKVVAVILAQGETLSDATRHIVVASAHHMGTVLRRWRRAEWSVPTHVADAAVQSWHKLWGPGYLTWKTAGVALATAVVVLLLIPFERRVSADVVVEAQVQQAVTAPYEGFLASVNVRPGDEVHKGQVLARFDDRDLRLEYQKDRSEVDLASGKLRQAMANRDFAEVQIISAQLEQAQAQLALVESKISRGGLTAPFDGTVITGDWRDQIGSPMEVGKKLFEIAPGQGSRVVLHVLDSDVSGVRLGQNGEIRLAGMPHESLDFHVSRITSVASVQDSKNGFRVEAQLDRDLDQIRPGMQGVGKIAVGSDNLLAIWTRPFANWLRLKIWSMW